MIYTTCRYAPAELFAGFGEDVERLDPTPSGFECAESCSHPNMCGFSKAVIEEVVNRHLTRVVLTDCCDAMRRTYDVLKAMDGMEFVYLLSLPHKTGDGETALFAGQLMALADAYEKFSGIRFDEEKADAAFREAASEKKSLPDRPYIVIGGAHSSSELVSDVQKVFGDTPVVNETCTGSRSLDYEPQKPKESGDFFIRYAKALLTQQYPCMRMLDSQTEADGATDPNALGTIFHTIKFCDYYSFRYLHEKNSGGSIVKIETDSSLQSGGQLLTRLEAFREELDMKSGKDVSMNVNIRKKENRASDGRIYTAGVDSGSTSTDAVIMDQNRKILGRAVIPTGAGAVSTGVKALQAALDEACLKKEDLAAIVSTGYGRSTIGIPDASDVTEITCHARGAVYLDPEARTVIDIGGQDSKVISVDENGKVLNFVMNDKCAAGTGRFLEQQARALEMTMPEMSRRGLEWKKDINISSMCTVFAESEVVSLVAQNVDTADIIHGLNKAIAAKTAGLAARVNKKPGYILTGGVAKNEGVVKCLEEKLGAPVFISPDAQLCGAIGAALIALDAEEQSS